MEDKIIVSLTSHKKRINTVYQTINTIINQTLKPTKIILWLSDKDFPNHNKDLPDSLNSLEKNNEIFEIKYYHQEVDYKQYNKLINTVKEYPNDLIITVDDDILYNKDLIKKLYEEFIKQNRKYVVCHRAHYITFKKNNEIDSYVDWFQAVDNNKGSYNNFLTGVGGVLYFPNCFYKDLLNEKLFYKLSKNADDIWFWAMLVLNKTKICVVKSPLIDIKTIPDTQECGLCNKNVSQGDNDIYIKQVFEYYKELTNLLEKTKPLKLTIVDFYRKKIKNRKPNKFIQLKINHENNRYKYLLISIFNLKIRIKIKK